jgi:hypothetical protein
MAMHATKMYEWNDVNSEKETSYAESDNDTNLVTNQLTKEHHAAKSFSRSP